MATRKARFHLHGTHGLVRYPDRTNEIELSPDGIRVTQNGDDDEFDETPGTDITEEYRILNDLIYPLPTPTWWERRRSVEIEDIFVSGRLYDSKILKIIVMQGSSWIWGKNVNYIPPIAPGFEREWNISDTIVESGVAVFITVQFLTDDARAEILSVGAQFDPTPE